MLGGLKRALARRRLKDPAYAWLFEPDRTGELVSIDCETTGLDPKTAEILSIGAVRIQGRRILASERLDLRVRPRGAVDAVGTRIHRLRRLDVADGLDPADAVRRVLVFVGTRPLVGYYLEFDAALLDRYARPLLGIGLPNERIEVSALYYDWRAKQVPHGGNIDLRFETIRRRLDLPPIVAHDAYADALMAAMMYLRLT